MTINQTDAPILRKPLRLWPGVAAVVLQGLAWFGAPLFLTATTAGYIGALGALAGTLIVVVWWAFFSRAPRAERWIALLLMIAAVVATPPLLHQSIREGGMGVLFYLYAVPTLCAVFVAWAVATRRLPDRTRRVTMVAAILLACLGWTLVRSEGTSAAGSEFRWRWSKTSEERLLARAEDEPTASVAPPALDTAPDWPGFRGPQRNGIIPGLRIETDWSTSPPVELWRRPIGPGWSSFAVQGDLIYTQEQRGEDEIVACYDATTGEPVWRHRDPARFWESQGGAGPRATPTLSGGRVYSLGATGILNVLDAADGSVVWSRDAGADTETKVPYWGFSGSPLVVDELVIVAASGQLAAYDLATGEPRWQGPEAGGSYGSPHLLTLDGVTQVVMLSAAGATGVVPADGSVLWQHSLEGYPIVQPSLTGDGDLVVSVSDQNGTHRLVVAHGPDGWTTEERWTSTRLKPYFNDFVVHEGHAYGFDGSILTCIDLEEGKRQWKGGRYGYGQLVLLPDQDLLLVITERGELALVAATPDGFAELNRFPALEGKTWNHPVLIDDLLLVRNGQEMAAFRLPAAAG